MDQLLSPEEVCNESFINDIITVCERLAGQLEFQFFKAQLGFVGCYLTIVGEVTQDTISDIRKEILDYYNNELRSIESIAFCGRNVVVIPLVD